MTLRKKQTMRKVRKGGYEGVYARYYGGKVTGYTSFVPDNTYKSGRRQLNTHARAEDARDERREELAKLGRPQARSQRERREETIASFYERWQNEFNQENRASSNRTNNYSLKKFLDTFGAFTFNRLPYDAVRSWGRTVPQLSYMKAARAFLNDANEDGLLVDARNPLSSIGRGEKTQRGRADIEIVSREELYALADCAITALGEDYGPQFRAYILFAAHSGMRGAELRVLLRKNLLTATSQIRVRDNSGDGKTITTPKNHQERLIAFTPQARDALKGFASSPEFPYVFSNLTGGRLGKGSEWEYWNYTRIAMATATGDDSWRGKDFYEVSRHYCGSWMLNVLELPAELVAHQLGHADTKLVLRLYGHPNADRWTARINEASAREQKLTARRRLRAVE